MWKLIIEDDEGKRTIVPLTRDDYTLGRKEGNTIRLTERNVSRQHAKLVHRKDADSSANASAGTYVIEDLTSYNGVYINGLRVAHSHELTHGDLIQIGDYRLILQDDSVSETTGNSYAAQDAKSTVPAGAIARASMLLERPNRLVMLAGPTPGAEYPLDQERMTIGRAEDASISVNHNSVSRLHCEVHALGDGRFEIVDKGSSNGVRVNSAELKRGIIEAGDVIELGDVRFKFIGAGQIFRPGASKSQQLSVVSERTASSLVGRRSASAMPFLIFALVVIAGSVGAYWLHKSKEATSGATATPENTEQNALEMARRLCEAGDCDAAHDKLSTEISENSPLRSSQEFHDIEARWAEALLSRADNESDVTNKRNLLWRVARAPDVDSDKRKEASDRLEKLAAPPASSTTSTSPVATPSHSDIAPHESPGATSPAVTRSEGQSRRQAATSQEPAAGSSNAASVSTSSPHSSAQSDFERESQLALKDPDSKAAAKRLLEAKVYGGRASVDEIRLLKNLCKEAGDKTCIEQCRKLLGQ